MIERTPARPRTVSRTVRSLALTLLAVWLAGCASNKTKRELAKFDGSVVPKAGAVPVLQAARKGLVTVLAMDSTGKTVGYGTGFYVAPDQVVTCLHVIDAATVVQIIGADGRRAPIAGIFAAEPSLDAAVLWVKNPPPPGGVLPIRPEPAVVGETVYALGAPEKLPIKQSEGEVLKVLDLGTQTVVSSLVLSVPVVPGFSGGPVLDREGGVVGITGAISAMGTNRFCLATPIELIESLRAVKPTTFFAWRKKFPAPPFPAFFEATQGEHIVNEDPEEALHHFERAILLAPDYARAWVQKASTLLRLGRIEEAEKAYARAGELAPSLPVPRLMRALCLNKLGRPEDAVEQLHQVIALQPSALQPRMMLVSLSVELNDFETALQMAQEAVRLAPDKPQPRVALATVLDRIGAPAAALVAFREAADRSPDGVAAWSQIAGLAVELDEDKIAQEACERVLAAPVSQATGGAEYLLALIALRAGDTAEAAARFKSAMEHEIDFAKQSKLPRQAIDALGTIEAYGVQAAKTHREMGGYFSKTGRFHEARAAMEQAVVLEPRDPRSWAGLAQVCASRWRDRRTEDAALRAIALNRGEPFANQSLGAAYALTGRLEQARKALEAELQITGPNPSTFLALASVEARAGRPATSKAWMDKARELSLSLTARFENRVERFLPDAVALRAQILPNGQGTGSRSGRFD